MIDKEYQAFLDKKKFRTQDSGFEVEISELPEILFDYQKAVVRWALRKGRSGVFAGTGTGKTVMFLSWGSKVIEKTDGAILLLAPLAVSEQIHEMAKEYGFDNVNLCSSQKDVKEKHINVTNYEKFHLFDPSYFIGSILDESSILKSFDGSTREKIVEGFKHIPYKLSCSASPSPNDVRELGGQVEYLGIMSEIEMLATFFIHDSGDTKSWRLKGHAEDEFWKWVASWAVMFTKPSDIGFSDKGFELPPLTYHEVIIPTEDEPHPDYLFGGFELQGITDRLKVRRQTIEVRVQKAAEIANSTDDMYLVWCDLNDESSEVTKLIKGAVEVKGSDKDDHKKKAMMDFAHGDLRVLVSKPKIAGFGMNWQKCHKIIYVGINDSWESLFQSVRRCWRFGQKNGVDVWLILSDKEIAVLKNLKRKEKEAEKMQINMIKHMETEMKKQISGTVRESVEYDPQQKIKLPSWLVSLN